MRAPEGVHATIRAVPHLLPGVGPGRQDPWRHEIQLVAEKGQGITIMHSDPIADMLTRIRNAIEVRHNQVTVPSSKLKEAIAKVLREQGYIQGYDVTKDRPQPVLRIWLKYTDDGDPTITALKRVSKPGCRIYAGREDLPRVLSGMGIAILSTSQGVMTDKRARRLGIGGEVLCYVW